MIFLWSRFRNILAIFGGFMVAILFAWIAGNRKGKRTAHEEDERESERVINEEMEKRNSIEHKNSSVNARDKLRNDGWTGN